jgi:hypothetical protein
MTDRQLEDKFLALAAPVIGAARSEALADACWNLLEANDFSALIEQSLSG